MAHSANSLIRPDKKRSSALWSRSRRDAARYLLGIGNCCGEGKGFLMRENIAVFGIYPTREAVEKGIEALRKAGFRKTDISVLFAENPGSKDFGVEKHSKSPEGVTTGSVAGGLAGTVLGWLVGIGALVVPGIGPLVAAGPLMAALAGLGVGGALGGISGALIGAGLPEYEAKRYVGRLKSGHILLSVHCDNHDWVRHARETLQFTGASDIATEHEARADFAESVKPVERGHEGTRW